MPPAARDRLVRIMADLSCQSLPPARWAEVTEILDEIDRAITMADAPTISNLLGELEALDTLRTSQAITATEPAPPIVRERIVVLVDSLHAEPPRDTRPAVPDATGCHHEGGWRQGTAG